MFKKVNFVPKYYIVLALFLLVVVSKNSFGYSYYYYDYKKMHVPSHTFHRYIVPQIRAIISEYYHIIRKVNPQQSGFIQIRNQIVKLKLDLAKWGKNCSTITPKCEESLRVFYKKFRALDKLILSQLKKERFTKHNIDQTSSILSLFQLLNTMSNYSYGILRHIEEILVTTNTPHYSNLSLKENISPLIDKMQLTSEMTLSCLMEDRHKILFEALWIDFIKELERNVLIDKSQKSLVRGIENYNISWNSFHMKLAKGNIAFPRKMMQIIRIMHNRWNSILKLYFKSIKFIHPKRPRKKKGPLRKGA